MRLYTIKYEGREVVAVENSDNQLCILSTAGITVQDMNDLICRYKDLKDEIVELINSNECKRIAINGCDILAPIPVPFKDIICLGVNYRNHIEETVNVIDFTKKADTVYFSKRVNRCTDPGGIIPEYDFVDSLDYEVELGVIIGRDAYNVSPNEADDFIFGYTIINDVSARNIQLKHHQWFRGKSLDGYTPMGPCIVTRDEITDAGKLDISCYVNDETRQKSNTAFMITTVNEAISELSQGMTLNAGTVIATGTPGGVAMGMKNPAYLKDGDVVKCVIDGIGELTNTVGKAGQNEIR